MQTDVHDPSSGFHDIKALPEFTPLPVFELLLAAGILAALCLGYLIWKKLKNASGKKAPALAPDVEAKNALAKLASARADNRILVRDFAAELSLILRTFLERELAIKARERTVQEIGESLIRELKKKLPTLPLQTITDLQLRTKGVLKVCERMAYADNAERSYSLQTPQTAEHLKTAEEIVREIAHWCEKERERTRSIVDESAIGRPQDTEAIREAR